MISFGSIPLTPPSLEQIAWARAAIDPAQLWSEFTLRTWPGRNLAHLPFWPWLQRPIELGRLSWPSGASRFACGHFVADGVQLAAVRAQAFAAGGYGALPLVIADGANSVTTNLFLLPAWPLAQCGSDNGMSLLTLVDDRYFWWFRAAAIPVTAGTTTWAQLYGSIAAALGIALTPDAIPAAYLKPPAALSARYELLPILLDAVAACVGQRIVRKLDGTVLAQNPVNGLAQGNANLGAGWPKMAGGTLALTA